MKMAQNSCVTETADPDTNTYLGPTLLTCAPAISLDDSKKQSEEYIHGLIKWDLVNENLSKLKCVQTNIVWFYNYELLKITDNVKELKV